MYSLQTDLSKLGATASALFVMILINFVKIFKYNHLIFKYDHLNFYNLATIFR